MYTERNVDTLSTQQSERQNSIFSGVSIVANAGMLVWYAHNSITKQPTNTTIEPNAVDTQTANVMKNSLKVCFAFSLLIIKYKAHQHAV